MDRFPGGLLPLALLLAAGLAGCAESDGTGRGGPGDGPGPAFEALHFAQDVRSPDAGGCVPTPCPPIMDQAHVVQVPFDRRAVEVALTMTPTVDGHPMHWTLGCEGFDEAACRDRLAEGWAEVRAGTPIHAATAVDLPPGTVLVLGWTMNQTETGDPTHTLLGARIVRVVGHLVVEPAEVPVVERWTPLRLEGVSGPCTAEEDCRAWPGGSRFRLPPRPGVVTAVNLTATWSPAVAPLDSRMVVRVYCQSGERPEGTCADNGVAFQFAGESPLGIRIDPFWLAMQELEIRVEAETDPLSARTPVVLEGALLERQPVLVSPGA